MPYFHCYLINICYNSSDNNKEIKLRRLIEKSMLGRAWVVDDDKNNSNLDLTGDDLVRQILNRRGINTDEDIKKFLNPCMHDYMPNPSVLFDMDTGARLISDAILTGQRIAIYGDYDVDGITSTAVWVRYLREIGADVIWHLPTREGEGYGLNNAAIDEMYNDGARMLITVDCGISGVGEVAHAKSHGMTVVITDHHVPDSRLPAADAVINPKRDDDTSGLNYLAGVGVAFLTLVATHRELRGRADAVLHQKLESINLVNFLDFVALGTICDTMPLIGLNRAFVATGLRVLATRRNLGLRVLMDLAGIKNPTVYSAGFAIGPRLNAAGRMDSAVPALELLLTDNVLIANDLAGKLHKMNQDRIDIQNAIMLAATDTAHQLVDAGRCSLFICGDNWHGGVMGIIAGRLKDKFNLPT
jgi:single-stranded-DNA-specific exonuclease